MCINCRALRLIKACRQRQTSQPCDRPVPPYFWPLLFQKSVRPSSRSRSISATTEITCIVTFPAGLVRSTSPSARQWTRPCGRVSIPALMLHTFWYFRFFSHPPVFFRCQVIQGFMGSSLLHSFRQDFGWTVKSVRIEEEKQPFHKYIILIKFY